MKMRGCNCGTVHREAHAPGCAGFAVELECLRADFAELEAARVEARAERHERDMRVAEAVREACIDAVAQSMRDGEAWTVDVVAVVAGVK